MLEDGCEPKCRGLFESFEKNSRIFSNLPRSIHGYPMLMCFGIVVLNHMPHTHTWPDHIKKKRWRNPSEPGRETKIWSNPRHGNAISLHNIPTLSTIFRNVTIAIMCYHIQIGFLLVPSGKCCVIVAETVSC